MTDPVLIQYACYIIGSLAFLAGSVIGVLIRLGVIA